MHKLTKHINTISRCTMRYRTERFSGSGLSGYQISYILHICASPGLMQDSLAEQLYINKSNVTRQLSMLEELGYITRRPGKSDRRTTEVYPSEKALSELPQIKTALREWNRYLLEDFSEEDRVKLTAMLEKISCKARSYADGLIKRERDAQHK